MRIPNAQFAIVAAEKLRDYLLDPSHRDGGSKSAFFGSLGYSRLAWRRFEADLRQSLLSRDVPVSRLTPHGRKFRIEATITGPNGRSASVVSIWIVRDGENVPRFVTAFPGRKR